MRPSRLTRRLHHRPRRSRLARRELDCFEPSPASAFRQEERASVDSGRGDAHEARAAEPPATERGCLLIADISGYPEAEEAFFQAGGAVICIEGGGAPTESGHTPISFEVDDVDGTAGELRGRGVVFEEYDLPSLKTVDGVATIGSAQAAWFKDQDGNLLAVASSLEVIEAVPAG